MRVATNIISESRGGALPCNDMSWGNKEVKNTIKIKRNFFRDLKNSNRVSFER